MSDTTNKSILVSQPGSDQVMLVVAVALNAETLDVERLLSALVPELARGGVRGGLLVLGDSTLALRAQGGEITVDELDTSALLSLAGFEHGFSRETIVETMLRWIETLATNWRDRIVDERLREVLVPHIVAGLAGDALVVDGIWGEEAHRLVEPE